MRAHQHVHLGRATVRREITADSFIIIRSDRYPIHIHIDKSLFVSLLTEIAYLPFHRCLLSYIMTHPPSLPAQGGIWHQEEGE